MIRVILVHPGEAVLPELGQELGRYASQKLAPAASKSGQILKSKPSTGMVLSSQTAAALPPAL
jgi:hypothetical protein